eukprot:scaffold212949_cov42-Prasinocladus_malaysianus.AAC.2
MQCIIAFCCFNGLSNVAQQEVCHAFPSLDALNAEQGSALQHSNHVATSNSDQTQEVGKRIQVRRKKKELIFTSEL